MNRERIRFWCGNPSVQLLNGELHPTSDPGSLAGNEITLVVNEIPASVNPWEVFEHLLPWTVECRTTKTLQHSDVVENVHLEGNRTFYMILLISVDREIAEVLVENRDNTYFNPIEKTECKIRYVQSYRFTEDENVSNPNLMFQRFEPPPYCPVCLEHFATETESTVDTLHYQSSNLTTVSSTDDTSDNPRGRWQDICISVLCGHIFHATCLERWCDSTCPVCRFRQYPIRHTECQECGLFGSVRMCLICGFLGCATPPSQSAVSELPSSSSCHELSSHRPTTKHADEHHRQTSHSFFLDVTTQRVWDYASDLPIQRMIQAQTSQKVILSEEHKNSKEGKFLPWARDINAQIATQLDSQRSFLSEEFEGKQRDIEVQISKNCQYRTPATKFALQLESEEWELDAKIEKRNEMCEMALKNLHLTKMENEDLSERKRIYLEAMEPENVEEIQNAETIEKYKQILTEQKSKITSLKETLRDLKFHTDSEKKGVKGGSVVFIADKQRGRRR